MVYYICTTKPKDANILKPTEVEDKVITVRGLSVILDVDVATLYGVETRAVNQAVKNNIEKFPQGYVFELKSNKLEHLQSKYLIANVSPKSRALPKAFTEKGLYMLATILKVHRLLQLRLPLLKRLLR